MLAEEPSYNAKTKIIADFLNKGASNGKYMSFIIWQAGPDENGAI
jgi:hypothetical protein